MQAGQFMEPEKGRGGKSEVKTHSFFRQETLKPAGDAQAEDLEGWLLPPYSNCLDDWSAAQTEHIPSGWSVGVWPVAVKHHVCVLQEERMSGSNSPCLVLRTDFSSSHLSSRQRSC